MLPLLLATGWRGRSHALVAAFQPIKNWKQYHYSFDCHTNWLRYPQRRFRRNISCQLFFRKANNNNPAPRRRKVNTEALTGLQSSDLLLPYDIVFDDEEVEDPGSSNEKLSIRFMQPDDIRFIMPLCIEEFGSGSTLTLPDFPFFDDWGRISNWWDRVYFEPSVTLSLLAKMNANLRNQGVAIDPALMVLCRHMSPKEGEKEVEEVVGMVELSLQSPEPNRNPPPFPIPLWIKQLYCRLKGNRIQGWVTNLLVNPRFRGLGYAKLLMAATEGVAKSMGCDYIYLHVDADFRSGKIAQSLYRGIGYQVVTDPSPEYAWMSQNPFSSIRIIEGVPLLCLSKQL